MCTVTYSRIANYSTLEKIRRFRESPSPKWAYIDITSACSHQCIWCYARQSEKSHHMPLEDFQALLGKLNEIGIFQVTLTGGEPLEHPDFMRFAAAVRAGGFQFHLASHGELLTPDVLRRLKDYNLKQIQFNFQGSQHHDKVHNKPVFEALQQTVVDAQALGLETVLTTVIGRYNYDDIPEIFREGAALGATRLRVWEVTGNAALLGDIDIPTLFRRADESARACGYESCVSYDPEVHGEFEIACPQLSNLYMYIDSDARLRFCPVVEGTPAVISMLDHSVEEIMTAHGEFNDRIRKRHGMNICAARIPRDTLE